MSSVYRLSISGIRSFGDEHAETIKFGKPLTLIVGTNGSGKTTIIECLRYATANELPPNTRNGASFINDPSLHYSSDTKAQIKLAFQNVNNVSMILSKSLMAVRNTKTGSTSFKTRENQLMAIRHGERQTLSSKIADIEQLIPQQLGVSKAVLTYVIFCHQDDNLWPISDSATLKKRFDEIFDSVRFIKVLEEIKNKSKELNVEIKVLNNDVEHLRNDKERARAKRDSVEGLRVQVEGLAGEMVQFEAQTKEVDQQLEVLFSSKQDYEKTLGALENLRQQEEGLRQTQSRIRATTTLMNEPKDVLVSRLSDFANFMSAKNEAKEKLGSEIGGKETVIEATRRAHNKSMYAQGKLESLYDQYEQNKAEKRRLVGEYSKEFHCEAGEFLGILSSRIQKATQDFEDKKSATEEKTEEQEFELQSSREEVSKEQQHFSYIEKDVGSLKRKKEEYEEKLAGLSDNGVKLETTRQELEDKEAELAAFRQQSKSKEVEEGISRCQEGIKVGELRMESVRKKMDVVRDNDKIFSEKKVLSEQNKKAETAKEVVSKKLSKFFTGGNLAEKYEKQVRGVENKMAETTKELEEKKVRQAELNAEIGRDSAEQERLTKDTRRMHNKVQAIGKKYKTCYGEEMDLQDFEQCLKDAETDYSSDFATLKNHEYYVEFNQRAIDLAKARNACLLCHREFHGNEQSQFFRILEKQNAKLSNTAEAHRQLKEKERMVELLREIRGDIGKIEQQKKSVEELGLKTGQCKDSLGALNISDCEGRLSSLRTVQNQLRSLESDVHNISHWNDEIEERNRQIQRISRDIDEEALAYSYDELEKEYKTHDEEIKGLRRELDDLNTRKMQNVSKMNRLESAVSGLKLEIKGLEIKSMDKITIAKAVEETAERIKRLEGELTQSKSKCERLQSEYEAERRKFETYKADSQKLVDAAENKLKDLQAVQDDIGRFTKSMQEYEEQYQDRFEESKTQSERLQVKLDQLEPEVAAMRENLKSLEKEISDASGQERAISDNIELYSLEEQLEAVQQEQANLDVKKAEAEREAYVKRSQTLQSQLGELRRKLALKEGEKTQIQRQIAGMEEEIRRDYRHVDEKYSDRYIELQTKLALVTDLGTCYKATDDGIMKFHHHKMAEINRIIDELWKKTYMGNDVESIMIKADPVSNKKPRAGTLKAHRSYNYRVVMVKNGVELDMRGRCSAGQRVLASIIIRLALAESFGLNFGMIALDEPTTNLDEENIESLAKALSKIIEMRSVQSNFQLIVITHDEKFLRYMNAVDYTDHYYRIVRDERLHSTINMVKISSLE